jgi:hypothetical protein
MLGRRRSGCVIMLLLGLFAAAMLVIHMRGAHDPEIARSAGGLLLRLDALGARRRRWAHPRALARGLWRLLPGRSR